MGTALITGASAGLGREFAEIFAAAGYDLVLTARDAGKLESIAARLRADHQADVKVIAANLANHGGARRIYDEVSAGGIVIDVLVNNAGSGRHGLFVESDAGDAVETICLNVTGLTLLTSYFLKDMVKRRAGKILNVSSACAFGPNPLFAVYGATKAYELLFTESLAAELEDTGVTVSVLCPGPTKTDFARRAGRKDAVSAMNAKSVAMAGYQGMTRGKLVIIPGLKYRLGVWAARLLPARMTARAMRKWQEGLKK